MRTLIWNLYYGIRGLRKNPGLTAAVIATLTLGIGATTGHIATVVYATLLAPLPYPEPNQLVIVWSKVSGQRNGISAGDFLDWQRQNTTFQEMAAWTGGSFNLATPGAAAAGGWESHDAWVVPLQGMPFFDRT